MVAGQIPPSKIGLMRDGVKAAQRFAENARRLVETGHSSNTS